jgi:hypothetical protein
VSLIVTDGYGVWDADNVKVKRVTQVRSLLRPKIRILSKIRQKVYLRAIIRIHNT